MALNFTDFVCSAFAENKKTNQEKFFNLFKNKYIELAEIKHCYIANTTSEIVLLIKKGDELLHLINERLFYKIVFGKDLFVVDCKKICEVEQKSEDIWDLEEIQLTTNIECVSDLHIRRLARVYFLLKEALQNYYYYKINGKLDTKREGLLEFPDFDDVQIQITRLH